MNTQKLVAQAKAVKNVFSEKNVSFLAGSIAYSAFVSLVPLLLFFILAVTIIGEPQLQDRVIRLITDNVSPSIGAIIEIMIRQQGGSAVGASIIGILSLIWGALKVFRGLDTAFSEIYETTEQASLLTQIKDGIIVLGSLTVAILAIIVATSVVSFFSFVPFIEYVTPILLLAGLCLALFPMYYLFPNIDVSPRSVIPGTIVGALGWAALQVLFQFYAGSAGEDANIIASILLLVAWLYFSGIILLLGATVNAVVIGRHEALDLGDTALEEEMDRDEASTYLRRLREDVAGSYESMRPMSEGEIPDRRPPVGAVSVSERVQKLNGERAHTVRLRWESDDPTAEE